MTKEKLISYYVKKKKTVLNTKRQKSPITVLLQTFGMFVMTSHHSEKSPYFQPFSHGQAECD